jgi:DNA polymerase-3 subunit alpha (Gram-positive type)
VPYTNNIHEFCPVQHPADDVNSTIFTTHFDYHSIDSNLLKLDELGHDDPTVIRMLEDLTGIDAKLIPLDDEETLSLFTSNKALKLREGADIGTELGTYGIPEFGTKFVRQMLEDTEPKTFSELVRISGLSHGTDVWLGNAQELIREGLCDLSHSICARDDIMIYLIAAGVEAGHSFKIMESVRKGKGLTPEDEEAMREANVPQWYIDSCKKIKYMFPKAHAVAYVMMAFRVAWFKVHRPIAYYAAYFTVRADDFDTSLMAEGEARAREALMDINKRKKDGTAAPKEDNLVPILELCIEMYCRGYNFTKVDLYKSHATDFIITDDGLLPPLNALPGLGENAAKAIMAEREKGEFKNIEDMRLRTGATKSIIELLKDNGCLDDMNESSQVSLLEM